MTTQVLTIEIPDGEDVETTIEEVQRWLDRGMTSGFYPTWTLRDEETPRQPESAEQITKRVLELESLGTWEERIKAAVYLARDPRFEVTSPKTPEEVGQQVLDNHVIRDDWRRTGAQIRGLIAEAIRIERGES